MATAKKPAVKKKTVKAKVRPAARTSVSKTTNQEGVWVRLGAVVFMLLAIAFLFMVLSKYA